MQSVFMNAVARTAGMVLVMSLAPFAGKAVSLGAQKAGKLLRRGTIRACHTAAQASKAVHAKAVSIGSRLEE